MKSIAFWGNCARRKTITDHSTRIKRNHLNKGKLQLNQKGTNLLSDIFVRELSKVFNCHNIDNLSKQSDESLTD